MASHKPPEFKFPMHNMHYNKSLANLKVACALALLAPTLMYALHNVPRKRKYQKFYAKYDAIDAFDRMMSGGYIDSFPPGSAPKKDDKNKKKKK